MKATPGTRTAGPPTLRPSSGLHGIEDLVPEVVALALGGHGKAADVAVRSLGLRPPSTPPKEGEGP